MWSITPTIAVPSVLKILVQVNSWLFFPEILNMFIFYSPPWPPGLLLWSKQCHWLWFLIFFLIINLLNSALVSPCLSWKKRIGIIYLNFLWFCTAFFITFWHWWTIHMLSICNQTIPKAFDAHAALEIVSSFHSSPWLKAVGLCALRDSSKKCLSTSYYGLYHM